MKKYSFSIAAILALTLSVNFLTVKGQNVSDSVKPTSRPDRNVVLIDSATANSYIENYQKVFIKKNTKRHTKWIYFQKSYFLFMHAFFETEQDYSGIRFYFSSYNKTIDATQQADPKQITLIMTPTDRNKVADFKKFKEFNESVDFLKDKNLNHGELCPNSCGTSNAGMFGPEHFVLLDEDTAKAYIKNYRKKYYPFGKKHDKKTFLDSKKHSKSMFLSKENFLFLGKFFNSRMGQDYDGIRISFASYNKIIFGTHQRKKKQITLILTPTKNKMPDFKILLLFDEQINKGIERSQSANHGELCPNSCPGH